MSLKRQVAKQHGSHFPEWRIDRYDRQTNNHLQATAHTCKSDDNDLNLVVKVVRWILSASIHNPITADMKLNPLHNFKREYFDLWVKRKMRQYDKYNGHDIAIAHIVDCEDTQNLPLRTIHRSRRPIHTQVTIPSDRIHTQVRSPSDRIHTQATSPSDRIHAQVTSPLYRIHPQATSPSDWIHSQATTV